MGKKKTPRVAHSPPSGKQVRVAPGSDIDWSAMPITWQFRQVDHTGCFGWHLCDRAMLVDTIMSRAQSFETMSWRELRSQKLLHDHSIDGLSSEAQERLREIKQDDIAGLCSLHIDKKRRVWGIQDRLYFKVLWWDPDHQVYPMNIKDN